MIRANIGGIDSIRASIAEKLQSLRDEENKLSECIERLGAMWEGDAHDVFQKDLALYHSRLAEHSKALAAVLGFEERAVTEYGRAEEEIEQKTGSL